MKTNLENISIMYGKRIKKFKGYKMENVIITQLRNQEDRIYEWLKYHSNEGFDSFIIFDDFSEDASLSEIRRFENDFSWISVKVLKTDGIGGMYSVEQCKNSESYGQDTSLHSRLFRSYDIGNQIVKKVNPAAICAIIDVDEFLITEGEDRITDILKAIFGEKKCDQLQVVNFDVMDDYHLEKGFIKKNIENFKFWDDADVNNHAIWKNRFKCIVKSGSVDGVATVHHILDNLKNKDVNNFIERDYRKLRMIHFRKPNLPHSDGIKYVHNSKLIDKLNKNL
jgi:hypothetical protein